MAKTKIEWTDKVWNPVTGCTKISAGCKNCYAALMAERLRVMGILKYAYGFDLTIHNSLIGEPFKWIKPRMIFVNSMSDLFHEKVPNYFIVDVFRTMKDCPQHIFQVLTKRPERMRSVLNVSRLKLNFQDSLYAENIWLGVSVENQKVTSRIDDLLAVESSVSFLSCEPLLGPLNLEPWLSKLQWVIVGGESGPHARYMNPQWVLDIRDQCHKFDVPFFFKQWGGPNKKKTGRKLQGLEYNNMPLALHRHQINQQLLRNY